jgi:hypothetical protein
VICLQGKDGELIDETDVNFGYCLGAWMDCRLQVMKFVLQDNEFRCFPLQQHGFDSFLPIVSLEEELSVHIIEKLDLSYAVNSTLSIKAGKRISGGHSETFETLFFALEADETIFYHCDFAPKPGKIIVPHGRQALIIGGD